MSKKLGLALGSGGARGVAHIGMLCALEEEGIKPDFIAGSSMGAVVGGLYASGIPANQIRDKMLKIKKFDVIGVNPAALTHKAILRISKIEKLLQENIAVKNIEDFAIKYSCVATDVLTGSRHVFESGDAVFAMIASSTIPAVFKPVEYNNKLLVDGGCVCRVPIDVVKSMGADAVIAMDVLKNCSEPIDDVHNVLNLILRVFDIMDAQNSKLRYERDKGMCDIFLQPEMKGLSQYSVKNLDKAFEEGYNITKNNMQKIKRLLD